LRFFRKYQKIFFIFIAFVIIVTFSFFGTQGVLERVNKVKDKDVAVAIDGSKIKLSEIQKMSIFLATDSQDISYSSKNHLRPNLFNNGFMKDFFRSDLSKVFFEKYFNELKPSFENKFDKVKRYSPFVHLYDPSISARSIYERYAPNVLEILNELKSQKELNLKFLNLLSDLYVEQMRFPSETMRRLLIFQEQQKKVQQDPRLYQDSIAFFGFENALDWFGIDFIDLVSEFIINTSIVAEKKGYVVTLEEAKSDLMTNLNSSLDDKAKTQIDTYYKNVLHNLSMDEKVAAKTWQKVMLYKKYFIDVSNNTLIDSLAYQEFDKYTRSKADIKLYSLPTSLHLKDFEDLIKFEMYLLATSNKTNPLDVPNKNKDLLEIEKNYPELIEKKYEVRVKQTSLEKVAIKIKVKDMYFWQLEDKNWNKLRSEFKFIPIAKDKQEKLKSLDTLEFSQKYEIDAFSRNEMVKESPNLIEEAIKELDAKNYKFYISLKNPKLPIAIKNPDELLALIDAQDKIENYTQDNKNYYSFEVVKRSETKELQSFEKAKNSKVIDKILNDFLKEKYFTLREELFEEFTTDDGSFKEFNNVRSKVAQIVFDDVVNKLKVAELTKNNSLDNLAKYRLYSYVENFKKNIFEDEKYLDNNKNSQFNLILVNEKISRSKNPNWIEKSVFSMDEKKYSPMNLLDTGNIEFFYLDNIKQQEGSIDKIDIAKNAMSSETAILLTKKLLKIFEEKKCIVFPIREKDERA
ncbi:MAG: hypothetical protein KR126chlam4_01129, partial [Candidatus Anoxychlamydiales bacterium]|nr:hypothetical protein [Candidatus Anoxychlamydiales bacterium]